MLRRVKARASRQTLGGLRRDRNGQEAMSNEALRRWQRIESIVGGFDSRPCGFEAEMMQEVAREGLPPSFAEGAVEELATVLLRPNAGTS